MEHIKSTTLPEILVEKSALDGSGISFIEGANQEMFLSYKELYQAALSSLFYLQDKGINCGDELVLQIGDNKTFIICFWACILGGIIPVPLSLGQNDDHRQKLFSIWSVLKNPRLVSCRDNFEKLGTFARLKGLQDIYAKIENSAIDEADMLSPNGAGTIHKARENDIAFLQFSSGSTGSPKGVVLTHRNLLTNIAAISKAAGYSARDSALSWMPLTHDMGLIGLHLNPLFCGMHQYLMPTGLFIRRPSLWLDKASQHGVTVLCSPNFGFKYLIKHCKFPGNNNWNLSAVRIIYNGAEPISEVVCREFLDQLAAYGLKSKAMCPVYGLAEATLAVSISDLDDEVVSLDLDRNKLKIGDKILVEPSGEGTVRFVGVGKPVNNCLLRVTDNENFILENNIIGNVQIKGDSVTAGYYNNGRETKDVRTVDGWLKTGDLGFIKDGSLYITGRAKDIIFVNGQNYYPHDIERTAEGVAGIELNKIAVAGLFNDQTQKEEIIAFVFHRGTLEEFISRATILKSFINSGLGIEIDRLIPVKDIPRTTSGKLQRFKLAEQFKNGDFDVVDLAVKRLMEEWMASKPVAEARNNLERYFVEIWKDVLKIPAIGVNQRFFDVGGNSLRAAEMLMRVSKELEVELIMEVLYKNPTIRELANETELLKKKAYVAIAPVTENKYYRVSSAQKRIYYAWLLDKNSVSYNMPVALHIKGDVNPVQLQDCINRLVERHHALRTSFHMNDEPVFRVHDAISFTLNCAECDWPKVNEALRKLVQPFDLEQAPLFRISLLAVNTNEYILFMDFHHIISDGISIYNFVGELFRSYLGKPLPLIPIQYKDYVAWESEQLRSEETEHQERYWLRQLNEELPVLELPLDFPRAVIFSTEGEKMAFEIKSEISDKLRALAKANQCSLHALMFTIYSILLSKYTGQEDMLIGIPVAGRRHPDLQSVLGMFVNNLVIRTTIQGNELFTEVLERQKAVIAKALDNQDYPFERLVQNLDGKRDVSRNPIFDSMFIYQNMGMPELGTADFSLSPYFFDPGFSKYDLSLELFDDGSSLRYGIEYATSLFRKDTIIRFAEHFENLIKRIIHQPNSRLSGLSIISDREYDACIRDFNNTNEAYPRGKTIDELFEQQAETTPDHIAIEFDDEVISYRELNIRVTRLADLLRKKGVGPNMVTGLLMEISPALIISMLAILKAGGCYLPIEPDLPLERIEFIISNSQCKLVVVDNSSRKSLAFNHTPGIEIINIDQEAVIQASASVPPMRSPHDLAYVIYTSGTTGFPKGVMIEHKSLVNYIHWAAANYVGKETAVFPLFTSVSFDLTVTSIFTPLITGNKLIIYKDDAKALPIEKLLADNKVDVIKLTPSHLKIILETKLPAPVSESRIKRFIVGGEQLETWLAKKISDKYGGSVEIYNEYGPTEATVGCMIHKFQRDECRPNVPIGIPAGNTQIYILDKFLEPVPTGVKGELYISGEGLSRGYLFNPVLTKQKVVPNPFIEGKQMYKTGDLARRLPEGIIEYLGRQDQQVKINGYRIELSEIENHLIRHPGIEEAFVAIRINKKSQKSLCAYYKRRIGPEQADAGLMLREYLAGRLPHYMIPAYFIPIEQVPLTRNGKVNYDALPEPGTGNNEKLPPANEIQSLIIRTWENVLGADKLSVMDNFFELGGDSIKAVQIASRLSDEGISISVKDILTYHTVEQISMRAVIIQEKSNYSQDLTEGERHLNPIEAWFFEKRFKNPNYYNQSITVRLKKKANIKYLEEAFKKLLEHHDGLRLNYNYERNMLFYNNSHLERAFPLEVYEINQATSPDDEFTRLCVALKNSFDITRTLLLRAATIKEDDEAEILFITAHHLVIDGLSWRILLEDLYTIYQALEKEMPIKLPLKTATLIEWGRKLIDYSKQTDLKGELKYWQEVDAVQFIIPTDFDTNNWEVANRHKIRAGLKKELSLFLVKEAHHAYKTDIPILLNAALALILKEWTGLNTVVIEQENHGRHLEGINSSRTLGWFTAMYPLKLEIRNDSLGNHIKGIKEQFRRVPAHGLGYGICKYLSGQPKKEEGGLVEIRLNYLGQFDGELNNDLFSYSDRSSGSDIDHHNVMTAKLELDLMIIDGELSLDVHFNKRAHKESTISWFTDAFLNRVEMILHHIMNEHEIHFTPSDFGTVANQEELDALFQ